jgi:hypothetical protein
MRNLARAAIVALALLVSCADGNAQKPSAAPPEHLSSSLTLQNNLLLIGWDGVQWNHLQEMLQAGRLPNLEALQEQGALVSLEITDHTTDTKAGWAQINTGLPASATGVYSDIRYRPIPAGKTIFERIETLTGGSIFTGLVTGKSHNLGSDFSEPWHNARERVDEWHGDKVRSADEVGNILLGMLEEQRPSGRFAIFAHFSDPDSAGHADGENSAEYTAAIIKCDEWLGTVRAKLSQMGLAGNTIIAVTTDHGFNEGAKSHGGATKTFFAANDQAHIYHSGNQLDIAPTLLTLLGVPKVNVSDMPGTPLWE